jgi:hypothetical protein
MQAAWCVHQQPEAEACSADGNNQHVELVGFPDGKVTPLNLS